MNKLVSVVLATYNGEKFLAEQLDSVIQQTYGNLEIIISDDCSTDNTWPLVEQYAKIDKRIKGFRNKENIGYTKNFENAILQSSGEYVAFCDQDDIWDKSKIEYMLDNSDSEKLIFSDSELIDENGISMNKKLSDLKHVRSYYSCLPFLIGNCVPGHDCLVDRSSLLGTLPFPDCCVYDWWLAFYFTCHGGIRFIDKPLVKYRQHMSNSVPAIRVGKKKKIDKKQKTENIKQRMLLFAQTAKRLNSRDAQIIETLAATYQNHSLKNSVLRCKIFFENSESLLALKKRNQVRKWLFCIKMMFQII